MAKKVLIIDDEAAITTALTVRLRAVGCEVRSAPDGPTGLREAQANRPDVILLDIRMPGMDGFAVNRQLKAIGALADVPVIFLSAHAQAETRAEALRCGGEHFLPKPCTAAEVVAAIEAVTGTRIAPPAATPAAHTGTPVAPVAAPPQTQPQVAPPTAPSLRGRKILIAEDDRSFLQAMAIRFGSEGLEVVTASDAYQALDRARNDRPDVIVLDVNIPAGNGFSVHERLLSMGLVSTPVIYVTGERSARVATFSQKLGAFAVIYKPCDADQLMAVVRQALAA